MGKRKEQELDRKKPPFSGGFCVRDSGFSGCGRAKPCRFLIPAGLAEGVAGGRSFQRIYFFP
jgi:hypothetical protein